MAFTSSDIGPWVRAVDRGTARANLRRVLNARVPAHPFLVSVKASLQVSLNPGFIISDEQDALQAIRSETEPGLEWVWDGLLLKLIDMRTLPPDIVSPL